MQYISFLQFITSPTAHINNSNCNFKSTQGAAVALSKEYSAPDRRTRLRGLLGEAPPYTLIAPSSCKIRLGCNVLQAPIQIMHLGLTNWVSIRSPWQMKLVIACVRTILKDKSQNVGNSSLHYSSPTLYPTYLSTKTHSTLTVLVFFLIYLFFVFIEHTIIFVYLI